MTVVVHGRGTRIADFCERHRLTWGWGRLLIPESWRIEACELRRAHQPVMTISGEWYCYRCGGYD